MGQIRMGYITFESIEDAKKLGQALVEEGLVACVNILGNMHSIYQWQGKVNSGDEIACLVKTSVDKWPAMQKRVEELHPYETPCVLGWDIAAGNSPYLSWVEGQLS